MKKLNIVLVLLALVCVLLSACQATPAASTEPAAEAKAEQSAESGAEPIPAAAEGSNQTFKFVFVQHSLCTWDPSMCAVEDGIKTAAKQMGVEIEILGPDKYDLDQTAALIDQAAAAKPDGLGLTITDPAKFKNSIKKAIDAGIPVIAYAAGSGPLVDDIAYLTYLGMDESQAGAQAAAKLIEAGAKKGVCINDQVGSTAADARCAGFVKAFADKNLKAEALEVKSEDGKEIADYFAANADADAVVTVGLSSAKAFYAFVDSAKPAGVKHIAFDVNSDVEAKVKDGVTLFAVDQQPFMQGYNAVMYLLLDKNYGIKPALPITATGPVFLDAKSVGVAAQPDKPVTLIMVQHAMCAYDPYWCVVQKGMEEAAQQMGVKLTILGPDKFDLEKTAALIDQAGAAKPDGIGLVVTDNVLFKTPIMKVIDAGIPVVTYDTGLGPEQDGIPYMTFWGSEDYVQGYYGGLRMVSEGVTRGVCINHQVGHSGLDARCKGFTDALTEKGIPAEVLGVKGEDAAQVQTTISDYYTANSDVDGYLTLGPSGSEPFYAFVEATGLEPGSFIHASFDISASGVKAIKEGITSFVMDAQPYLIGYGTVESLVLKIRYNITPATGISATGPGFVDKSNVEIVEKLAGTYR
jgi:simple sugar transport system substrate-binding protein